MKTKLKYKNKNYTLVEAFNKGFERSKLSADRWSIIKLHECYYGSKDFIFRVENFRVSNSEFIESISFRIDGDIPIHQMENGKIRYGFSCDCPKDKPIDLKKPFGSWLEKQPYFNQFQGFTIFLWINSDKNQEQMIKIKNPKSSTFNYEEKELITRLVESFVARKFFQNVLGELPKMEFVLNSCYGGYQLSKKAYEFLDIKWDGNGFAFEHDRSNPKLIKCIKKLGDEANGETAQLRIEEVYAGTKSWHIDNYDGIEYVTRKVCQNCGNLV